MDGLLWDFCGQVFGFELLRSEIHEFRETHFISFGWVSLMGQDFVVVLVEDLESRVVIGAIFLVVFDFPMSPKVIDLGWNFVGR